MLLHAYQQKLEQLSDKDRASDNAQKLKAGD